MKIKNLVMAAFAAVFFLTSCGLPVERQVEILTTGEWKLTYAEGIDVKSAESDSYTINFKADENSVFGKGDCNRYFARYMIEEGTTEIDIESLAMTRMACPNGQDEDKFIQIFDEVEEFYCVAAELTLVDEDNEIVAIFNPITIK